MAMTFMKPSNKIKKIQGPWVRGFDHLTGHIWPYSEINVFNLAWLNNMFSSWIVKFFPHWTEVQAFWFFGGYFGGFFFGGGANMGSLGACIPF